MLADILQLIEPSATFSAAVAQALYVGIMTDTGGFRFPRTTGRLHRTVADLIDAGADPVQAHEAIFNTSSIGRMNMLGEALCSLRTFYAGRLCVMVLTAADLKRHGCTTDDVEGYVHHTLVIDGVQMGIMIVELADQVKISFRSKGQTFVRDLAATFGGGGHVYAAGARIQGQTLDTVVHTVVERAETFLAQST
jgi:phosphoesterase RecJ-like protein